MTSLTLACAKIQKKVQSGIDSVEIPQINWRAMCFIGLILSISLLVLYVAQVNSLTENFFTLNIYEKKIKKISDENKNLQVSFAESSFLGQALTNIKALNFQKTLTVKYIQIPENILAKN